MRLKKNNMHSKKDKKLINQPTRTKPVIFPLGFGIGISGKNIILEFLDSQIKGAEVVGSYAISPEMANEIAGFLTEHAGKLKF